MSQENNFLVDTDIIIYWMNNKFPKIDKKIREVGDDKIFISSITIAELYFGAYNSYHQEKNIRLIHDLISEINIVALDARAGEQFGMIKFDLMKKGKIINDSDLFIAATAISNNMVLVSNNEKHFRKIRNLKIENWTK